MSCLRFNQSVTSACRDSQPGVSSVWLANYDDVISFTTDTAGVIMSGLTCSGDTGTNNAFYVLAQNKNVAAFLDTASINIQNGTAVSLPKLTIKLQGLSTAVITAYKELLQSTVTAIVKTIDGKFYAIGFNNGLDATVATIGSEADSVAGFKGATFELTGIETTPFYELDPSVGGLASKFISDYQV